MRQSEINWLRHPRGRGKIYQDAEISINSYLSKDSVAAGSCEIQDSYITNKSIIEGNSKVFGGFFRKTYVGGDTIIAGNPIIQQSIITGKSITGTPRLMNCVLKDYGRVSDQVFILGKSIQDPIIVESSASVYGSAQLIGSFRIHGKMRVNSGRWFQAPWYRDLGFTSLTETESGMFIECRNRSVDYWLQHGPSLAQRFSWTSPQIEEVLETLRKYQLTAHH